MVAMEKFCCVMVAFEKWCQLCAGSSYDWTSCTGIKVILVKIRQANNLKTGKCVRMSKIHFRALHGNNFLK